MISARVIFCVILIVWEIHCVLANPRGKTDWNSPIDFVYRRRDELNVNIVLWNIPPGVNNYVLLNQTAILEFYIIPQNKTINLTKKLFGENVTFEIQLLEGRTACTRNIIIINGKKVDDYNRSSKEDEKHFEVACLNKKENFCLIHVDFTKTGMDKAQKPANITCARVLNRYTCKSPDEKTRQDTEHNWSQTDANGVPIGAIPVVTGKRSIFTFDIQKFDNMSHIIYEGSKIHNYIKTELETNLQNYDITKRRTFSEKEKVSFTCEYLVNTHIGVIDPTGYKILTYPESRYSQRFSKADHGSMLCCLYYNVHYDEHDRDTIVVERSIKNITLLLYEEAVNHNNGNEVTIAPVPGTNGAETPRSSYYNDKTSQINSASRPGTNGVKTRGPYNDETSQINSASRPGTNGVKTRGPYNDETSQINSASRPGTNGVKTRGPYNDETSQINSASRPGTNGVKTRGPYNDETSQINSASRPGTNGVKTRGPYNDETSQINSASRPGTNGVKTRGPYNDETSQLNSASRPGINGAETPRRSNNDETLRTTSTLSPRTNSAKAPHINSTLRPGTKDAMTPRSDRDDHTATIPKPAVQDQTPSERPHDVTSSGPAGSVEDPQKTDQQNSPLQASDYTKYYIAMALAAAVILLSSLIYAIIKKCTRKASDPEVKLQLETYANTVLVYAQLDIRPGNAPPPASTIEDTTYAQIIGVLKPVNDVKK